MTKVWNKGMIPVFWLLDKTALSCDVHTRIVSAALDRKLTPLEKTKYFIHGLVCHLCRRYEKQLKAMRKTTRQNAFEFGQRTNRALTPESKERMKNLLKDA